MKRCFVILAVLLLIVCLSYYLTMHFSLSFELFFMASNFTVLLFAFIIICCLLSNKEYLKIAGWLKILCVLGIGVFSVTIYLLHNDYYRNRKGLESTTRNCINEVGKAILSYVEKNGLFPDKKNWAEVIVSENKSVKKYFQHLGNIGKKYPSIAFNQNLSNLISNESFQEIVLLIEADGSCNFTGSQELLHAKRKREEFYPDKERFIFVFFVDSTFAKYRICDGALAIYNPDEKKFSKWKKKDKTNYSPLKWGNQGGGQAPFLN